MAILVHKHRDNLMKHLLETCKSAQPPISSCREKIPTISCKAFGSTHFDSDVDVTVSSDCVIVSIGYLNNVYSILHSIYAIDLEKELIGPNEKSVYRKYFMTQNSFSIERLQMFLDVNFYLSDFGMKKRKHGAPNNLESYFVTADYVGQYKYALYELNPKQKCIQRSRQYQQLVSSLQAFLANGTDQSSINGLVNTISNISTFEDESYHTQGSYFHIVLIKQQLSKLHPNYTTPKELAGLMKVASGMKEQYVHMFATSCVENLVFQLNHYHDRSEKYRARAEEAMHIVEVLAAQNEFDHIYTFCKKLYDEIQTLFTVYDYDKTKDAIITIVEEFIGVRVGGQRGRVTMLKKGGEPVQKLVQKRMRNIYVDSARRQYVMYKKELRRLVDIK
jgi:hypothetical protein